MFGFKNKNAQDVDIDNEPDFPAYEPEIKPATEKLKEAMQSPSKLYDLFILTIEQNQALSKRVSELEERLGSFRHSGDVAGNLEFLQAQLDKQDVINTKLINLIDKLDTRLTALESAGVFDKVMDQKWKEAVCMNCFKSDCNNECENESANHPSMQTDKEVQEITNQYVNMVLWLISDGKYEGYSNESLGKLIRERLDSRKSGAAKETSMPTIDSCRVGKSFVNPDYIKSHIKAVSMPKGDTVTFEDNGKLFQMSAEDLDKAITEQAKRKWNDAPVKFTDYRSFREISGTMDEFVAKMKATADQHGAKVDLSHAIESLKELESFPFKLPSNRKSLQASIEILEKHNNGNGNGKK